MKKETVASILAAAVLLTAVSLFAQDQARVFVPSTTVEHAEDIGVRAHTNHLILVPPDARSASGPSGETPASLACVYQTVKTLVTGCPINGTSVVPIGGLGIIAIIDAYDYPTAQADFDTFSTKFGLPLSTATVCNGSNPCFKKVYASGKPKADCGWAQEAALDIEWAHAMAPYAQIVLVEARSSNFSDLLTAVGVANSTIAQGATHGGIAEGEVSMSWSGSEFSSEASYDSTFGRSGVAYFAASGDTGGQTGYPAASPNVVAAGGTSVNRDKSGKFSTETGWSGSGGGPSKYEPRPSYQTVISSIVGKHRGIPDFSFDANPSTGVSVYDSTSCGGMSGWMVFGGTSVSSPSLAGVVNLAGHFYPGTNELSTIYSNLGTKNFRDITSGSAGSYRCAAGWDFVTGVGSNLGLTGK